MNQTASDWKDYEVIDAGNKEKLERWNDIILRRPDPVALWPIQDESGWNKAHAIYHRSSKGGGKWEFKRPVKEFWTIGYKDLRFKISPTGFKHTGLFPEQAANWDFIMNTIRQAKEDHPDRPIRILNLFAYTGGATMAAAKALFPEQAANWDFIMNTIRQAKEDHPDRPIRILNLFAYTGGATMAAAKAGADEVVHLDASKGINNWAKENMELNHLENKKIRFLVDDVMKFLAREIRRGRTYDGIIMDPPSYGRGPNGEVWKLEDNIFELINQAQKLLSDNALFMIVNLYTTGFPLTTLRQTLDRTIVKNHGGYVEVGETLLPVTRDHALLPCGLFGRWTSFPPENE